MTGAPSLDSGFRDEGVNWKANTLYQPDAEHPHIFRVVYPDKSVSADFYNLALVKRHCRDVAGKLYPRHTLEGGHRPHGNAVHSISAPAGPSSHTNASGSVTAIPDRPVIRAELRGDEVAMVGDVVAEGHSPVFKLCRLLIAAGADPDARLECHRDDVLALIVRSIGEGATLTVRENKTESPKVVRYVPFPDALRRPDGEVAADTSTVDTAVDTVTAASARHNQEQLHHD